MSCSAATRRFVEAINTLAVPAASWTAARNKKLGALLAAMPDGLVASVTGALTTNPSVLMREAAGVPFQ